MLYSFISCGKVARSSSSFFQAHIHRVLYEQFYSSEFHRKDALTSTTVTCTRLGNCIMPLTQLEGSEQSQLGVMIRTVYANNTFLLGISNRLVWISLCRCEIKSKMGISRKDSTWKKRKNSESQKQDKIFDHALRIITFPGIS
jgi:hypothetical protein